LLALDSEHTVCFDREGGEITWPEFVQTVAGIADVLAGHDGRYWAVDADDSFLYGCALFGCWCADKTPVLAPAHMLADGSRGIEFDGVIAAGSFDAGTKPIIRPDEVKASTLADPIIPSISELILFTSGSTGEPTSVHRNILNIEAELDVLESLFGDMIGESRVYSTVCLRSAVSLAVAAG
jgi:acyl-CoA synthetase (AMP-forming)/AMP-acid ligase II